MSDNNDGSSSPSKRRKADIVPKVRRNATNVTKWFKVINDRKHCMYDECTASYALTTSTTNLMYHLTSEHELFLIDVEIGDEIDLRNSLHHETVRCLLCLNSWFKLDFELK